MKTTEKSVTGVNELTELQVQLCIIIISISFAVIFASGFVEGFGFAVGEYLILTYLTKGWFFWLLQ